MFQLTRRILFALVMAGMIAALFRLRGKDGVPPQNGGWSELTKQDLN